MNIRHTAWAAALGLAVAPAFAAQEAAPNDAQIAAIVVTANQVDIDAGELAKSKATSPAVKEFAQRMITDHTAVNTSAKALAKKLNVTPESSPTSESLEKGGDQNVAKLKTLSGAAFDQAYAEHEVDYHQSVIDALDKTLIPSAKNAELKDLLVKTRPAFIDHLQHAKKLQASLGKGTAAGHDGAAH